MGESFAHPAVYSASRQVVFESAAAGAKITEGLVALIERMQQWARACSYLVGHIKVFVGAGEDSLWLSATGGVVSVQNSSKWESLLLASFILNMTVIIFGPSSELLRTVVDDMLAGWSHSEISS